MDNEHKQFDNPGELLKEAKKRRQKKQIKQEEKVKGLEFMSTRFNVVMKCRELKKTKFITPAEYFLLEEIQIGTNGGQNQKWTMSSTAEFFLEDLSNNLGYKSMNKIWTLVKSLHQKGLITREYTRSKGREILGLNSKVFGQILIDSQHLLEQQRQLKMVVDNSKKPPTVRVDGTHGSCVDELRSECVEGMNHVSNPSQNDPLEYLREDKNSYKGEKEVAESYTLPGIKASQQLPDPFAEMNRQLELLRQYKEKESIA